MAIFVTWLDGGPSSPTGSRRCRKAAASSAASTSSSRGWARYFLAGTSFYLFRDKVRFTGVGVVAAAVVLVVASVKFKAAPIALPWLGSYLLLAVGFARPGALDRVDSPRGRVNTARTSTAWPIQELIILQWRTINPWVLSACTVPLALAAGCRSAGG